MNASWSGHFEENILARKSNNITTYKISDMSHSAYSYSFLYLTYVSWSINNTPESVAAVFAEYFSSRYHTEQSDTPLIMTTNIIIK